MCGQEDATCLVKIYFIWKKFIIYEKKIIILKINYVL